MGKRILIKPGYEAVAIKIGANWSYAYGGDTVELTDAEFAALVPADLRAVTVIATIDDPPRPNTSPPRSAFATIGDVQDAVDDLSFVSWDGTNLKQNGQNIPVGGVSVATAQGIALVQSLIFGS